jgi:hypothetical protein
VSKKPDGPAKGAPHATDRWGSPLEASALDRDGVIARLGTPADLSIEKTGTWAADPYNKKSEQSALAKRRSLDDMRRLSEAIKAGAQWTPQNESSAFFDRLAALRADLECTCKRVEALYGEALHSTCEQSAQGMAEQLRNAVDQIENALDELMPPEE